MAGIPTVYGGVRFRSRLEARWAAFFDLLEWRWEYEPLDLEGYIPDFMLTGVWEDPFLVEVKPIVRLFGNESEFDAHLRHFADSGWRSSAIVVGAALFQLPPDALACGACDVYIGRMLSPARAQYTGAGLYRDDIDLVHRTDEWHLRHDDRDYLGEPDQNTVSAAVSLWREAGNRVQWRKPT